MINHQGQLSQAEIDRVFRELGLATQQDRDQFSSMRPNIPSLPTSEPGYVIHVSNRSQAAQIEGEERAELE